MDESEGERRSERRKRQKRPERLCLKGTTTSSRTVEANTIELTRNCRREEERKKATVRQSPQMPVRCDATRGFLLFFFCFSFFGCRSRRRTLGKRLND